MEWFVLQSKKIRLIQHSVDFYLLLKTSVISQIKQILGYSQKGLPSVRLFRTLGRRGTLEVRKG